MALLRDISNKERTLGGGVMMQLQAMIVHLGRATGRVKQVDRLRHELSVMSQIVDAIDGTTLTAADISHYERKVVAPVYPFDLRHTEIACFLSHRKCWQHIVDQNLDAALILEDDVSLELTTFQSAMDLALAILKPGDFIRFPIKPREVDGTVISSNAHVTIRKPKQIALGMVGQIVTKEAAVKLLSASDRFDRPVDCFLQMDWLHGVNVLSVWPSGVSEISQTLGGSMIDHKTKSIGAKIKREILRPIYRSRIKKAAQANTENVLQPQ
jgi:GR25 family glycosyltransferase involved in LPS biosynthesis